MRRVDEHEIGVRDGRGWERMGGEEESGEGQGGMIWGWGDV